MMTIIYNVVVVVVGDRVKAGSRKILVVHIPGKGGDWQTRAVGWVDSLAGMTQQFCIPAT